MDSEDNHESFEMLLNIDQQSRKAIEEHNNQTVRYVNDLRRDGKKKYEKNVTRVKQIITNEILTGKITADNGESVMDVIKSEYLRPWEDSIGDMLAEYERSRDVKSMIDGIIQTGKWIGLENKPKSEEITESAPSSLKMVGAIFIMGEKFDSIFGRTGMDSKY